MYFENESMTSVNVGRPNGMPRLSSITLRQPRGATCCLLRWHPSELCLPRTGAQIERAGERTTNSLAQSGDTPVAAQFA
ncbi:hypothetical protein G6F60_014356 [Rhizopus arrhizus]|nr:hypothetical protein G6F60_014356 [Rhizopus arrhizus]